MKLIQKELKIRPKTKGFHLITDEVSSQLPELEEIERGVAFLHLKHTSAALTMNENADPDVRTDLESIFSRIVPRNEPCYTHTLEGPDDMPAHAKSSMIGAGLTIPITSGRFNLGTWQGIYLCEHRDNGGVRGLVVTVIAEV
jgi:secondary thiamine-phosphate synthase enzyme